MSITPRVQDILNESALRSPEQLAVIDRQGSYSYRQLHGAANQISRALCAAGVEPLSVIGISLVDARTFLASLFGVLQAGCVAIPIATNLTENEQLRVLAETQVSWIIFDQSKGQYEPSLSCRQTTYHQSLQLFDTSLILFAPQPHGAQALVRSSYPDAAVIRYTSGTTARSRGVVISHTAVWERTEASRQLLDVADTDVVLAPLPLSYHFIASALSWIKAGATIIDCANLTAPEMIELGGRHGATMIYGSPIQYELLSRAHDTPRLMQLRRAISTSALLSKHTAEHFFERFGVRLTQVYGIIEVGLPLWNDRESLEPTALGLCKPPYAAMVVDDVGTRVPTGTTGELVIQGPGLFSGYLHESSAGPANGPLRDGWFHTGDLVTQDDEGAIHYCGRKKSVINCGGNKVFPEEVEEVLRRLPEIRAVRVSAEPHPVLGNLVIAEVVVDPSQEVSVETWRSVCYSQLSRYKVPKEFRIIDSLASTGSGKLVRYSGEDTAGTHG